MPPPDILLAEDNDDHFFLIEEVLQCAHLEANLHRVKDGVELLKFLQHDSKPPALILLDLNMPCKSGRVVLKELKKDPEYKRIPIIVLTTSRYDKDRMECEALGVQAFISKPTSFDDFVELIKENVTPYLASA